MADAEKAPKGFLTWWKGLPEQKWAVVVAAVILAVIIGAVVGYKSPATTTGSAATLPVTPTTGVAKYQASFQAGGIEVTDASDVAVYITVKNIGGAPGTPDCMVSLSSPSGAYYGTDEADAVKAIPPGGQASYMFAISINNNGAASITQAASTVTCS